MRVLSTQKGCEGRRVSQLLTLVCLSLSIDMKTRLHNSSESVWEMADSTSLCNGRDKSFMTM